MGCHHGSFPFRQAVGRGFRGRITDRRQVRPGYEARAAWPNAAQAGTPQLYLPAISNLDLIPAKLTNTTHHEQRAFTTIV
jgi:hypothetical protein